MVIFSLFFGGVGIFFVVDGFPRRGVDEWRLSTGGRTALGVVRFASDSMSEKDDGLRRYDFDFSDEQNQIHHGACYAEGQRWEKGANVTIRYLPAAPAVAVIEGARLDRHGWSGVFTLIFPVFGFGLFARQILAWRRVWWLLRNGTVGEVQVVAVEETTQKENYQSVYRIVVVSPLLNGGAPVTIRRVNTADVRLAITRVRERQPVFVLYDPKRSDDLLLPEALIA